MGILAYELLVGYPPFEQESRAATYEHIMYKVRCGTGAASVFSVWCPGGAARVCGRNNVHASTYLHPCVPCLSCMQISVCGRNRGMLYCLW